MGFLTKKGRPPISSENGLSNLLIKGGQFTIPTIPLLHDTGVTKGLK